MKLVTTLFERVKGAAEAAAQHLDADGVDAAIVLGSGLGGVSDRLAGARSAPYSSLPGFPETTVAGHPGRLITGTLSERKVLLLCGRVHGYEGYAASEVGFGVRVAAALGARTVIATNAAGGVDPAFAPGQIVGISDHINLTGTSPLTGPNDERLGPRFVDMTDAYAPALRALAAAASERVLKRPLAEAIYAGMAGPAYETPAEVRLLRTLGAGLVGMSTVHEVITARHAGLAVLGLSLVANAAAGVTGAPLRHEDVTRAAAAGAEAMGNLIAAVVASLPEPGVRGQDRGDDRGEVRGDDRLLRAARAVRRRAHAPYSRYQVGAAVRDERGRIHVGCNVENASYGLTVCAERNAVAAAVAAGAKAVRAVAVVTPSRPPGTPCGACRQVLSELGAPETRVLLAAPAGKAQETTLGALFPRGFRLARRG